MVFLPRTNALAFPFTRKRVFFFAFISAATRFRTTSGAIVDPMLKTDFVVTLFSSGATTCSSSCSILSSGFEQLAVQSTAITSGIS
ncbi:unnamed protein product [Brugia timori]|uniref:Uncharacterized protein n=1 Tax=Brugia timori TaxID=42155 RepID=A0A3P7UQF3_9BILA|nr:unnamed protein product [Brugia timori]